RRLHRRWRTSNRPPGGPGRSSRRPVGPPRRLLCRAAGQEPESRRSSCFLSSACPALAEPDAMAARLGVDGARCRLKVEVRYGVELKLVAGDAAIGLVFPLAD